MRYNSYYSIFNENRQLSANNKKLRFYQFRAPFVCQMLSLKCSNASLIACKTENSLGAILLISDGRVKADFVTQAAR